MGKPREDKVDAQLIDGKPHFGLWFGSWVYVEADAFAGDPKKNPLMIFATDRMNGLPETLLRGEEIRYKQVVVRPPLYANPFQSYGSIGVKYVIWGRAFRVMAHIAKGVKRYKKMYLGGKRKWVRVDKR
jgi:hypothetical protein